MKKLLTFLLAITLTSPLYACGKGADDELLTPPEAETTPLPDEEIEQAPPIEEAPPEEVLPVIKTDEYVICTGSSVNLRSSPSSSSSTNIVGSAEKNTQYSLVEKTGNWYAVYYKNNLAYLHMNYARTFTLEKSANEKIEQVIELGYKLIGTKYVYGATRLHNGKGKLLSGFSIAAFDCSSLMQYMFYYGAGVNLGLTTREQVVQGAFVKREDLQRGDCIYFTNSVRYYKTGIERVGHVGIYLGDGYMLHTSSDYARIEKMDQTNWKYYIEARRFV